MSKNVKRLYKSFIPKHYDIDLNPDRDAMHLSGTITITGKKVDRPSQRLTFHQHGLKITSASIVRHDKKGNQQFAVARINHQRTADEVRLHIDEQLFPGAYTITMTFEGEITRAMDGIYPCFFKQNDQEKVLIATQFESHHAREAFPCIDEPEAKATFQLTLTSPIAETVISNTPIKTQVEKDGKLHTTFEETPKMSTYLLAFIYGELAYLEAKSKRNVVMRTYATPDNIEHTQFALDIAVKCLDFYEEYFDIPYPLAKCDFVALPDFASGAMENWGCITFREHALFVDPANTSLSSKQYVAMVVAHELTHQWFGNLVTMRWWTDLWLNEGFANWMEYLAPDHLFPEWNMWTQYIVDEQQIALKLDALENTHAIEVPINHPDEIRTIFDTISYSKGGSSIQMLAQYLGPEAFRDGLRHYLKKHAYKNTDTIDLWDSLETVSKKPVKKFMAAWTSQAGYPLVQATITGSHLHLSQEPFLLNPLSSKKDSDTRWPIALRAGDSVPEMFDTAELEVTDVSHANVLKLNHEQSGFYRVAYNAGHIARLAEQVKKGKLSPLDRLGLLGDTFETAKAGYTSTTAALTLLKAYADEDNNAVWDVMVTSLAGIRGVMNDDELRETIKPYSRQLIAKQFARLGWEEKDGESHFDRLLRPTILAVAAVSDEASVVAEILRRFDAMTKSEDIQPDLRGVVYTTAARKGNVKTFEKLLHMHNESPSSEERITLAAALTDFEQPELIERALQLIDTDTVRHQDVLYWIAYSFSNRFAREATWDWLVAHWSWIKENLGTDLAFYRMPVYSARAFSDAAFLPKYKQFFESVMEPALERSYKQGIEMIEWQSAWRKRDLAAIKAFFKDAQ
jgi:aminopeptidase N